MSSLPRSWSLFRALFPARCRHRQGLRRGGLRSFRGQGLARPEGLEARAMLAVVTWDGGTDGTGTVFLDPVNWAGDILPQSGDTAEIGATAGLTAPIVLGGSTSVAEIRTSRSLEVTRSGEFHGTTLTGTDGATLVFTGDGDQWRSALLDGVTTAMDLDLGRAGVDVRVTNLALTGATVRLGDAAGRATSSLTFYGSQTLAGTGTIVLGSARNNAIFVGGGATTADDAFTIGAGITIRGNSGRIVNTDGQLPVRNLGTILSDASVALPGDPTPIAETATSPLQAWAIPGAIDTSQVVDPLPTSAYAAARVAWNWTNASYAFPGFAPGSAHRVRLHLVDAWGANWGGVEISVNGRMVVPYFNVMTEAGGMNRALVKEIDATADADGTITLALAGGYYAFNGIEVLTGAVRTAFVDAYGSYLGRITVEAARFDNLGTVGSAGRGTLALSGNWSSAGGTVLLRGGNVELRGTFPASAIGAWDRQGGVVNLLGTLENAGGTLRLDATTGSWTIAGGTIRGGRIEASGGSRLLVGAGSSTLDAVTLACGIDVVSSSTGGTLAIVNGITLDGGAIRIGGRSQAYGSVTFRGEQTVDGTGEIVFGGSPGNWLGVEGTAAQTLTIGSGITLRGSAGSIYAPFMRVVNGGTILADGSVPLATDAPYARRIGTTSNTSTSDPIDTSGAAHALPEAVYKTLTYGNGPFAIGLDGFTPGGSYLVRLHFAELWSPPGNHSIQVDLNGTNVLSNFDVAAEAGGMRKAITRDFTVAADAVGSITALFRANWGPYVNAIEVFDGDARVRSFDSSEPSVGVLRVQADRFENRGQVVTRGHGTLSLEYSRWDGTGTSWTNPSGTIAIDGGTLDLGGRYALADLGAFTRNGGSLTITGVLDNTGGTLSLPSGTGEWQLGAGGTIKGGRIEASSGATLVVRNDASSSWNAATLDGVVLATELRVGSPDPRGVFWGGWVSIRNGLVMDHGSVILGTTNRNQYGYLTIAGSQSITGTGDVILNSGGIRVMGDTYAPSWTGQAGTGNATIGAGITLHGQRGSFFSDDYYPAGRLTSEGTIVAERAPDSSYDSGIVIGDNLRLENRGQVTVLADGRLTLGSLWSNAGAGRVDNAGGLITLKGSRTLADMIGFHRTAGSTRLTSTLDLQHGSLDLDSTTGPLLLDNATLSNGRVQSAGDASISVSWGGATLDAVELAADLELFVKPSWDRWVYGQSVTVRNGLTLDGATIAIGAELPPYPWYDAAASTLRFVGGSQTLAGTGEVVFGSSPNNRMTLAGSGAAGETFTIARGITVRGHSGTIAGDPSLPIALRNQGAIRADATMRDPSMGEYDVGVSTYREVTAIGGPIDRSAATDPLPERFYDSARRGFNWAPLTYTMKDLVPGDVYRVRLHFATLEYWWPYQQDVEINGLRVLDQFDTFAAAGGNARAVVREFDATADASGAIVVRIGASGGGFLNALELLSGATRLRLIDAGAPAPGGITVSPTTFLNEGTLAASGGETLAIAPADPAWTTSGTVVVGTDGRLTTPGDYRQTGGETRLAGGVLDPAGTAIFSGGVLSGTGTIQADVVSSATVRPTAPRGAAALSIGGTFTQTPDGRIEVRATGPGAADRLVVSGNASVDGTLALAVAAGNAVPSAPTGFPAVSAATLLGTFATFDQGGANAFALSYDTSTARLTIDPAGGPMVTGIVRTTPANAAAATFRVTFSEPMAAGSFTADDIAVSGPSGPLDTAGVTIAAISDTEFDIAIPALADGTYTLALGPGVTDSAGTPMIAAASTRFANDAHGPRVIAAEPTDGVATPLSSIDVVFDAPIDPTTFTAADIQLTAPSGNAVWINSVRQIGPSAYQIKFAKQKDPGVYTLVLGPDVRDQAGNPLDQDGDGAGGGTGDTVTRTFVVGRVDLAISDVTMSPGAISGGTVTVSWTVTNLGDTPTSGRWEDDVFLRRVDTGETISSNWRPRARSIPAGGSARFEMQMSIPDGPRGAGDLRLDVFADYRRDIDRWDDAGNNSASVAFSSALAAYPDLVVQRLRVVERSLAAGGTMTLRWNDANQGSGAINERYWYDTIRVVDTTTGAVLLDNSIYQSRVSIPAGGSKANQYAFTLPSGFDPATATLEITVVTDPWGWIPEYDSSGSLKGNNTATITWTSAPTTRDLSVTALAVVDSPLHAGQTTQARVDIANTGTGDTGDAWSGRLVVVNTTTGATIVDRTIALATNLAAGGTLTSFIPFDIPAGADGIGDLEITFTVDATGVVDESNDDGTGETNNTRTTTVASTALVYADLKVANLTVSPASPQSGGTVTLRWDDVNAGAGPTGRGWTDRIVVVDVATGAELVAASLSASSSLGAAGSLAREYAFTLPAGSAGVGDWSVTVTTDHGAVIDESNEAGDAETNNAASTTLTSVPAPTPDLQVTNLTVAPTSPLSGETVTVRWNVINAGDGATGAGWTDRIAVVNVATGAEIFAASVAASESLAASGSLAREYPFTLPSGHAGVGDWRVTVTTDHGAVIDESNADASAETNNAATATLTSTLAPVPDLEVTGLRIDESTLQSGQVVTLRWNTANTGTAAAGGGWYDRVRVVNTSRGETIVDTYVWNAGGVDAGGSSAGALWIALPNGPAGVGEIAFEVTADGFGGIHEDNVAGTAETNNTASISRTSALAPYPDLVVAALSVSSDPLHSGDTVTIRWTDANQGDGAALAGWYDRIRVVNTTVGETIIDWVAWNDVTIAVGGSREHSVTLTLPEGARGTGQIAIEVTADLWNYRYEYAAVEDAEANNSRSMTVTSLYTPVPDLVVEALAAPATAQFGGDVQISWVERNAGDLVAAAGWRDAIYLSADGVLDGGDMRLAILPAGGTYDALEAGASATRTATVTMPLVNWLSPGSYRLLVVANHDGRQRELGRGNNVTASAEVTVTLPPLPDLVVSGITAPAKGFAGQDVTVSWTVTNQGAADYTGPLLDVVRLSADASLGGDNYVNALFGTVTIPVGASITRVLAVTLPVASSGNSRFVVETDAAGHAFEHAADANNASIDDTDILVEVPPLPNLVVSVVTVPTGGFSSAPVTVAWTVTNTGTGATNAPVWADAIYLSTDDTLDAGDIRLGSLTNPAYLAAGDSYSSTATVTLPRGISGGYRMLVVTDETNSVYEGAAEGDNTRSGAIDVTLTPPPDLQVASVSAPTTANSGTPMTVSWTVQNAGTGRTAETAWVDSVYLSADTVLDGADRLLGTFAHAGRLAAGGTYAASGSVLLPVGVSGSFHVFIRTDAADEVYEHTAEDNNVGYRATPVTVNLTPPPDLVVGSVVAPATALADASIVVAYRVSNDGASSTPENAWLDELFLSSDASFDPATDTLLASQWHYGALEADGGSGATAYDASFTATLPRSIAGAYTLFVVSDRARRVFELADARANNVSAGAPLTVSFLPPDLVAESLVAPASAASGGSVRLGFTVRNQGTGPTSGAAWSDRIVLSSDASYGNSDDLVLATIDHAGSLAAGASYTVAERNVQIPLTVPSGDYFLFAVADAADRVFEDVGENNNASAAHAIAITRITADLTVTAVAAAPATLAAGSQVTVDWTVANAGAAATNANWWNDSVWLSADDNLGDANDVLLGVVQRNDPLAAGAGYAASQSFTVPGTLAAGNYRVLVATDSGNRVIEGSAEGNNAAAAAGTIAVTAQPRPNLVVSAVTPGALAATAGRMFSVTWIERNGGAAVAAGRWYDSAYLSLDQALDSSDRFLGYVERSGPLAAGEEASVTGRFRLPQGVGGGYYVFVVGDAGDALVESDESDNRAFGTPVTIDLPPPADLVGGTVTVPSNAVGGGTITVEYTVRNDGVNAASGAWTDSLFLSADDAWDSADVALGRVEVSGTVGGGESYTRTLTAAAPGLTPGDYRLIVRSDIRNAVPESNESNNILVSLGSVTFDVPDLTLGATGVTGTLAEGASACYRIVVPVDGETVRVTFDSQGDDGDSAVFLRRGSMPTAASFDLAAASPFQADQTVTFAADTAGTWYALVQRRSGSGAFTLRAETVPFSITAATPAVAGTGGEVTLRVAGARFATATTFRLVAGDGAVTGAVRTVVTDSTEAYATFDTTGLAAGSYVLEAVSGDQTVAAAAPVELHRGSGAEVVAQFEGPISVRPNTTYSMRVLYGNAGDRDVAAPLLIVSGPAGIALGGTASDLAAGGMLQLLATSVDGPAGTLRPGSQGSAAAVFRTLSSADGMEFTVRAVTPDDAGTIAPADWAALEQSARPAGVADAAWTTFWAGFRAAVGVTWGDYVRTLGTMAAATGGRSHGVRGLFAATLGAHPSFDAALGSKGMLPAAPVSRQLPELPPAPAFGAWRAADQHLGAYVGHFRPRVVVAIDPNDIVNPVGFGAEQWIPADRKIPYTIRFENAASASAPAQVVRVTQALDPDLNANSFRLGDFGFDRMTFEVPDNVAYYTTRLDLRATRGYAVDVAAGIDVAKREAFWTFTTIDPATGEQPVDASVGFLPVNDATGRGDGFVSYSVKAKSTAATGARIDAGLVDADHDYRAVIVFDTEAPILTPSVFNTLDASKPSSAVAALPGTVDTATFPVAWEGSDTGSGLAAFSVWVSVDGGPWTPWLENTTDRSADYEGAEGHTYAFYSVAVDNVGNVEAAPSSSGVVVADASTRTRGALLAFGAGGSLAGVIATYGSASGTTSIAVTGSNLVEDVVATAPAGFEISADGSTFSLDVRFTPVSGVVAGTLFVRLSASAAAGTYSGTVTLASAGAPTASTAMPASTVNRKALAITAHGQRKTYGDADPALTYAVTGLVGVDTVSGGLVRAAGGNVGTYAISQGTLDAGANYAIAFKGAEFTITPKTLTVGGLAAADRTYDGTAVATVTGTAALEGVVAGDAVGLSSKVTWAFPSANAGPATLARTGSFTLTNNAAGNYTIEQPTLTATINPRPVSVTGMTATNRVYDGTTVVKVSASAAKFGAVTGVAASGVLTADATGLTLDGSKAAGSVADKVAGTKTVTVAGLSLAGTKAGNYTIQTVNTPSVTISKAPISVSGLVALDKPFDGTNAAKFDLAPATLIGVFAGDAVTIASASGTFAGTNVGTYAVAATATTGGADAGNYTLAAPTGLSASITAKQLTISGLTATGRVYDATTNVAITGTAKYVGLAAVDATKFTTPTLSGARTAAFADKHAGVAKPVTVNGYVAPSTNYTLAPVVLAATITPKALTVTGAAAVNRTYDGTRSVAITGGALVGTIAGDAVSPAPETAVGTTADKKAGLAKAVTVTGYSLSGADAGNYAVTQPAGLKVNIDRRPLAVTGVSAANRTYDGTTVGTLTGTAVPDPTAVVAGDAVTAGGTTKIAFADGNVGSAKPVTVTGYTLAGLDAANYLVQQPTGLAADITRRTLTITGLTATSRVYDGTTNVAITGTAKYGNLATVDATKFATPSLDGTRTAAFADKHAATAKPVAVTGYVAPSTNYALAPLVLAANITKKAVTITGAAASGRTYDGTTAIKITGGALAAGAIVAGDDAALDTTAVTGSVADKKVGVSKPVTVTGYALTGTDAGNYALAQPTTLKATITARSIAVTGLSGVDREYDATTVAQASGTAAPAAASLVAGDDLAVATGTAKFTFATSAVGVAKAITASGFTLSGADAGNYAIVQPVGLKATVTQATIMVTGPNHVLTQDASGKVVIPTLTATISGLKGTDAVTGTATLSTTATASSAKGVYAVKVSLGTLKASANYKFTFVDGSITIQ